MILGGLGVVTAVMWVSPSKIATFVSQVCNLSTATKLSENTYIVPCYIRGTFYTLPLKIRRRPSCFSYVEAENEEGEVVDATEEILQLLGPSQDMNHVDVTPRMLGYNEVRFYNLRDLVWTFEGDSPIRVDSGKSS